MITRDSYFVGEARATQITAISVQATELRNFMMMQRVSLVSPKKTQNTKKVL